MNKHTPGPWFARPAIRSGEFNITAQSGGYAPLAKVKGDKRSTSAQALHNARLMAGAPDLLQALKDLLQATPETYDNRHERTAAQDAIAKATGES
jgi:hypothetical protein